MATLTAPAETGTGIATGALTGTASATNAGTGNAVGAGAAAKTGGLRDLALSVLAPASWGTTYVLTATVLPSHRPLLAATLRALPAGLLLLAAVRRLPQGIWWWRTAVLGTLNFGAFLPLMFYAAYHLPGGVAATIGSVQPLAVAAFSTLILKTRPARAVLLAALAGTGGVALMTLTAKARLDALGVAAMLTGTALMALAVVLGRKWGRPEGTTALTMVSWQLVFGGLTLLPLTLLAEGWPATLTAKNIAGFAYLGIVGTAVAYTLWFRGIERIAPTSLSLLTLANPIVATAAGFVVLHQSLTAPQAAGFALALGALVAGQLAAAKPRLSRSWRPTASGKPAYRLVGRPEARRAASVASGKDR